MASLLPNPNGLDEEIEKLRALNETVVQRLNQTTEDLYRLLQSRGTVQLKHERLSTRSEEAGASEVQELRRHIRFLETRLEAMEQQCQEIAKLTGINTIRIDGILASRTWKILTSLGGLWLKLRGKM
jgi:signal transduction histidine kinase